MLRVLDLFSGIGAFSLGLERTGGFRTVAFCEIEAFPRKILAKHWPGVPIYDDVRTLTAERLVEDGIVDMAGKLKKLTLEDVNTAISMYQDGKSLAQIAEVFHVGRHSMHDVLKRRMTLRPQLRCAAENHFYRGGADAEDRAHNAVENAIRRGKIVPQPCEICGSFKQMKDGRRDVQAHHDDYSKPLEVRWLCQIHHHEWHRANYLANSSKKETPEPTQIDVICGGFP
jgi:hypothetical protein